jgi:hypothetical protein
VRSFAFSRSFSALAASTNPAWSSLERRPLKARVLAAEPTTRVPKPHDCRQHPSKGTMFHRSYDRPGCEHALQRQKTPKTAFFSPLPVPRPPCALVCVEGTRFAFFCASQSFAIRLDCGQNADQLGSHSLSLQAQPGASSSVLSSPGLTCEESHYLDDELPDVFFAYSAREGVRLHRCGRYVSHLPLSHRVFLTLNY